MPAGSPAVTAMRGSAVVIAGFELCASVWGGLEPAVGSWHRDAHDGTAAVPVHRLDARPGAIADGARHRYGAVAFFSPVSVPEPHCGRVGDTNAALTTQA